MTNIRFSYENQNQFSYLTATFPPTEKIVTYQLQMMTSNEIHGLLSSMKRQKNEDVLVYYNITSRVSLSQILGRRKLSRKEFLNLLSGAVEAWKEVQEYQLECDGLYFQEEYIYVTSDTCEPSFVYLPIYTSSRGIESLKEFIQRLILKGVVETSSDNFIQILLNMMNDHMSDINRLEECIQQLKDNKTTENKKEAEVVTPRPVPVPEPIIRPASEPVQVPIPPVRQKTSVSPKKPSKKKDHKKIRFLLFQVIFLAYWTVLLVFRVLTDTKNWSVAALVFLALEFVIYREIFVNCKKSEKKEKKTQKKQERIVEIPGTAVQENRHEIPPSGRDELLIPPAKQAAPIPSPVLETCEETAMQSSMEEGADETDFWDPAQQTETYLEYMEDGSGTRIVFHKESLLIGRLSNQVDFVVNNPKVGKIHAEFICKNGCCYVRDLNSKNGTYINGSSERITSNIPCPLSDKDRVALADSEFVVHC